jgi:hypothetical protein
VVLFNNEGEYYPFGAWIKFGEING